MAADSRVVYKNSTSNDIVGYGVEQKLFVFDNVVIATFGEGVDHLRPVPYIINTGLRCDVFFDDAITFLSTQFRDDPGVQAYVGGITKGEPQIKHIRGPSNVFDLESEIPAIWAGGVKNVFIPIGADARESMIAERMLNFFESEAGEFVGPPYQFAELNRNSLSNRRWRGQRPRKI